MRAVVLPALVDIPKDGEARWATELERDLVPVPQAAASVILPPPEALELELAEVRPNVPRAPSIDVEPPPPPIFDDQHVPPALPLEVTAPELVAAAVAAVPTTGTPEADHASANPVESVRVPDAATPIAKPVAAKPDAKPPVTVPDAKPPVAVPDAKSLVTAPDAKSPEAESSVTAPDAKSPVAPAPEFALPSAALGPTSAIAEPLTTSPRPPRRLGWWLAIAWVTTAAIPAIVVWAVMRSPKHFEPRAIAEAPARVIRPALPVAANVPVDPATPASAVPSVSSPDAPGPSNGVADSTAPSATSPEIPAPSNATADDSAATTPETTASASLAPTVPVLVQTDASDRIDVLVKSKPTGARVYRLGKEIARTPVTIQIGRGERRVFEIGSPSMGTKRVAVDGQKTEILVTLVGEASPAPVNLPAPLPSNKYDRLR